MMLVGLRTFVTPPALGVLAAFFLCAGLLRADAVYPDIQSLVVFGDRLSDAGRLGGQADTSSPYLLWVDYLAADLGISAPAPYSATSNPSGRNFAHGGGTAIKDLLTLPFPDGTDQIDEYLNDVLAGGSPPEDALMVVWFGTNDLLNSADPEDAADAVYALIQRLANAGAKQFLLPELLPLGMMPYCISEATSWDNKATAFNDRLDLNLALLASEFPDAWLGKVRVHALFAAIRTRPAAFGYIDITTVASDPFNEVDDPEPYLWWSPVTPTSLPHEQIAEFAAMEIASARGISTVGQIKLSLAPSLGPWTLSLWGPSLPTITVEMSSDGISWTPIRTITPFQGLESIQLEGEETDFPRFYRAR